MPLDLTSSYVFFSPDGASRVVPGGTAFRSLPAPELDEFGQGWLVTEFECTDDWPNWEIHPEADRLVYLLSGDVDLLLDTEEGVQARGLVGSGAMLVPKGVWHTARVHRPSRFLHITRGVSTEHWPVGDGGSPLAAMRSRSESEASAPGPVNVDLPGFEVVACTSIDQPGWLALRKALWPRCPVDEHQSEMAALLDKPERFAQFVAYADSRRPAGFVEASVRRDLVNGNDASPVAFLEGIQVMPAYRRRGVARRLVAAVSDWASALGCVELASDVLLDNDASQQIHGALGFEETERVVYYRKALHRR